MPGLFFPLSAETRVTAAVLRHGELLRTATQGGGKPETLYQTGSLGKHFTAALALLLGVDPDQPVAPYLRELPSAWTVTMRHLLSHTAGIPSAGYDTLDVARDYTDAEIVQAIGSVPLDFPPGDAFHYSNAGYVLAGIALGRRATTFYGDLLRDRIFTPLGMVTATVNTPAAPIGFVREGGLLVPAGYVSPSLNRLADGGITLSILDLARWEAALTAGWAAQMFVETPLNGGTPSAYGLGWFLSTTEKGRLAEHDGAWQGFSTAMVRYLDQGVSAIVLANVEDADAASLAHELAAAALVF